MDARIAFRYCVLNGWIRCLVRILSGEVGFPRDVSGHKPVPTRLFPFVAFSVPEVSSHRPFPVAAWFLPQGVSGLVVQDGGI